MRTSILKEMFVDMHSCNKLCQEICCPFLNTTPLTTGFGVGIFPEKQEDTHDTESFDGAVA